MKLVGTKTFLIIIMIALSLQLSKTNEASSSNRVFTLPNDKNTYEITVPAGEEFVVKIRGNPTTGYGWFLSNPEKLQGAAVQPTNLNKENSAEFVSDDNPEGFVGVGGYYLFKFKANGAANSIVTLNFINKRPWMDTVDRTVAVKVSLT